MSRFVLTNKFALFACQLDRSATIIINKHPELFPKSINPRIPPPKRDGTPIALRWVHDPLLGFPRRPFKVWRRAPGSIFTDQLTQDITAISGSQTVEWKRKEMYQVSFTATPDPGKQLIIDTLDSTYMSTDDTSGTMPNQRITVTNTTAIKFTAPGITALRIKGNGQISQVQGINAETLVNDPEWQLIEVVGLPFAKNEIALPSYAPDPQGYLFPGSAPLFQTGLEAANIRLQITQLLEISPPHTGLGNIATPQWVTPNPTFYLNLLRNPTPAPNPSVAPLRLIQDCLTYTNDKTLLQPDFRSTVVNGALYQSNLPPKAGEQANTIKIPVVGMTMLMVSSDSFAATGLGYGTVDFPDLPVKSSSVVSDATETLVIRPTTVIDDYQYMVTAVFSFEAISGKVIELAALAQLRPAPVPPQGLSATLQERNRAAAIDQPETGTVKLNWELSPQSQAYAIVANYSPNNTQVLNQSRGKNPTGKSYNPFIPQRPAPIDGDLPSGIKTTFKDSLAPLPTSSSNALIYFVSGLDVFGRWSAWSSVTLNVTPPPVLKPNLHSVEIQPNAILANGHSVPSAIAIEFSWDWTDRSPEKVELFGNFFPANAKTDFFPEPQVGQFPIPPSNPPFTGFALANSGNPGNKVVVTFANGIASVPSNIGSVKQLPTSNPDPNADVRRYRLTINNVGCDFNLATAEGELAYAVYIQASEKLRPQQTSGLVGPQIARVFDPIPPDVNFQPIEVNWTALADATGRARGVLNWNPSTNVKGYVVWEATEVALRHALNPAIAKPDSSMSLLARVQQLRQLVDPQNTSSDQANYEKSLQAFSRLNTQLITNTQLEVELPGQADSLYVYRISGVGPTNLESARSTKVAIFAVPKRNQPGQPRLLLRVQAGNPSGIRIIVVAAPGDPIDGYQVYRVHNPALLEDIGAMGPPKIQWNDPGWQKNVPFSLFRSENPVSSFQIVDSVSPSWHPYFYRVVALGHEDPPQGEFRGESLPSISQKILLPPPNPPSLDNPSRVENSISQVISFQTDLPLRSTSVGVAKIEVIRLITNLQTRKVELTKLLSVNVAQVAQGSPLPLITKPQGEIVGINHQGKTSEGKTPFTVRIPAKGAQFAQDSLVVTDPLGRSIEWVVGNPPPLPTA